MRNPSLHEPSGAGDEADEDLGRLLRASGTRREPPQSMRERVHAQALATFQGLPEAKHTLRWARIPTAVYAAAAALLVVAFTGVLWQRQATPAAQPVLAYVNFSRGSWQFGAKRAPSNMPITAGATLSTATNAALELQLIGGALLRVAPDTQLTLAPNNRIKLHIGRLFVDVHGSAQRVHVLTPQGEVTDIGTEFEVQVAPAEVSVRVREGRVLLRGDHTHVTAVARSGVGESLRIDSHGHIQRGRIATSDPYWDWLAGARPAYALDRGSLHDFLSWSASATGLSLRYQSEAVRRAAVTTHTRGSIDGMQLTTAIDSVLATTHLQRVPASAHELLIDFAGER